MVAKFSASAITSALAWVLSVRGRKGFGREQESIHNVGVDRDSGLTLIFDVGCLTLYFYVKTNGGGHDVSMLLD